MTLSELRKHLDRRAHEIVIIVGRVMRDRGLIVGCHLSIVTKAQQYDDLIVASVELGTTLYDRIRVDLDYATIDEFMPTASELEFEANFGPFELHGDHLIICDGHRISHRQSQVLQLLAVALHCIWQSTDQEHWVLARRLRMLIEQINRDNASTEFLPA